MNFKASEVFEELNNAINARNDDGSRKYTIIILEGGSRSSKTWSIYQQLFLEGLKGSRRRIAILRDTKEDCRNKVEPDFVKWYNDPMARAKQLEDKEISIHQYDGFLKKESFAPIITENKTKHVHKVKSTNNTIEFTGADDQDSVIGLSPDVFWVNEPYLFDKVVFDEVEQRTNDYTIIDWNPRFDHWIDDLKLRDDCIVLHSTFHRNPFLKRKVRDGILKRQPLSNEFIDTNIDLKPLLRLSKQSEVEDEIHDLPDKIKKEIVRCWNNEKQKTADKYRWEVYGLGIKSEKPDKIYSGWERIEESFFDQINEPIYYGLDLGITSPTACVAIKYRENCLFIHQLLYLPGREIDSLHYSLEQAGVDKKRPIICDRTVRGMEHSDTLSLLDLHSHGFSYAIPAIKGKGSVFNGIEAIQKCRVYVTTTSTNVWEEYYTYEFSKWNGQITDQPVKKNDHAMDAARMAFNYMRIELSIAV